DGRIERHHGAVGTGGPKLQSQAVVWGAAGVSGEAEHLALLDACAGFELADESHQVGIADETTRFELEIDEVAFFGGAIRRADRARAQGDDRRALGEAIDGAEI